MKLFPKKILESPGYTDVVGSILIIVNFQMKLLKNMEKNKKKQSFKGFLVGLTIYLIYIQYVDKIN